MTRWQAMDQVRNSPDPSVAEHVRRYLATDGADGYLDGAVPNLLLTVVGRRTGALHRTALFFGEDDGRLVLVASGSAITDAHPSWYLNLRAHPEVHVQVRGERFLARARTAEGEERERLWELMATLAPVYRNYYEPRTRRVIPVVVLEPSETSPEPAGGQDRAAG
jgi:F420H(2)-dependent quinone reductase